MKQNKRLASLIFSILYQGYQSTTWINTAVMFMKLELIGKNGSSTANPPEKNRKRVSNWDLPVHHIRHKKPQAYNMFSHYVIMASIILVYYTQFESKTA